MKKPAATRGPAPAARARAEPPRPKLAAAASPVGVNLRERIGEATNRAAQLLRAGRPSDAVAAYDEVLALAPDNVDATINRGVALRRSRRPNEAMAAYLRALHLSADNPAAWINAANLLIESGRTAEARVALESALGLRPQAAEVWQALATLLLKGEHSRAAEACLGRAARIVPQDPSPLVRLGSLLSQRGEFEAALARFEAARRLGPLAPGAHSGYGQTLIGMGRLDEAERHLRRALELDADQLDAHLGLARLLLLKGELGPGWVEYEWRRRKPESKIPKLRGREWSGEPLAGKTLLVHSEQGFGDVIQFARYIPLLAARGARVIFAVPGPLARLLKGIEGAAEVTVSLRGVRGYDCHIPLLSVPRVLGISLDSIPAPNSYLTAPPSTIPLAVPLGTRLKVGMVWAGSPRHSNDRNRSVGLDSMLPIAAVPGVALYGLQTGARVGDVARQAHPALIDDLSRHLRDFADTASVIARLDLVVCANTAVAHLAAALGKPVWVLMPFAPDWRWLLGREDTPWYPTMRLFRQREPGRWDDQIDRIVAELRSLAAARPGLGAESAGAAPALAAQALARFQEGSRLQSEGKVAQALAVYAESAALDRRSPDLYNNLGVALRGLGRLAAAEASYRRALALGPPSAGAVSNLGNLLRDEGRLAEAAEAHRQALALRPDDPKLIYNSGLVPRDDHRPEQAAAIFERVLALAPDDAECRWDLALARLQQGDYARGLPEYEARWGLTRSPPRKIALPRWTGEPLAGRSLFLHDEQGFGDLLMFARFLPEAKRRGAGRIVLECQPELVRLMALAPGVDAVIRRGAPTPACDVYAPLLSLAGMFGVTLDTLPRRVPYLRAPEPELPLPVEPRLKLGLVWAGKTTPRDRSIPLGELLPLFDDPRYAIWSLQVGPRAAELKSTGADMFVADLGPRLIDFAETAATLRALDLLVTVDTAAAHLAGALGVPVFTLLRYNSDWRWGDEGSESAWYPTMRLFRQTRPDRWDEPLAELARALDEFAGKRKRPPRA